MTRHGYVAYSNGCRCKVCREAKAAYLREKRADAGRRRRLVESGGGRYLATGITHGYNGYQDYGCRCETCRDEKCARDRQRRAAAS